MADPSDLILLFPPGLEVKLKAFNTPLLAEDLEGVPASYLPISVLGESLQTSRLHREGSLVNHVSHRSLLLVPLLENDEVFPHDDILDANQREVSKVSLPHILLPMLKPLPQALVLFQSEGPLSHKLGANLPPVAALHLPLQATEGNFEEFIGIKEGHVSDYRFIEFSLPSQPMKHRSDSSLK